MATLFAMIAVWFVLCSWLFRRLRERHASTYEAIGSPTLFWNNSIRNGWLSMKFLLGGHWRSLGDSKLATVCSFMRVFFVLYLLLFLGPVALVFSSALAQP